MMAFTGLVSLCVGADSAEAAATLREPEGPERTVQVSVSVITTGSVFTAGGSEKSQKLPIEAEARFRFRERRLPSGGRDAQALRSAREFEIAQLETTISGRKTGQTLPEANRMVVSSGAEAGVWVYCPSGLLSRESMDLLELPGDPLALQALLPTEAVDVGAKWSPQPWAIQMLSMVEAVQKSAMTCELTSLKADVATIQIDGSVLGQQYGANSDVKVSGQLTFDTKSQLITTAKLAYTIKANIGTVSPGIDARVETVVTRQLTPTVGKLSDVLLATLPISPPSGAEMLAFDAAPWKVQLLHDRGWHLFQAVLEGNSQVVIFRLMENGSLICQSNVAKLPTAAPGKHASIDQFEADIQASLGKRFKSLKPREKMPAEDGRIIYRVVAEGQTTLASEKGATEIPMQWNYYLLAAPSGQQLSFVFAIEPQLVEQLKDRDLEMVQSVRFIR
jgi:hypothetical protein